MGLSLPAPFAEASEIHAKAKASQKETGMLLLLIVPLALFVCAHFRRAARCAFIHVQPRLASPVFEHRRTLAVLLDRFSRPDFAFHEIAFRASQTECFIPESCNARKVRSSIFAG
jgi:hypothetical protein